MQFTCLFLDYSTPWDCIVDFHNTPHGFTLAYLINNFHLNIMAYHLKNMLLEHYVFYD